jgi:hypothetical protein
MATSTFSPTKDNRLNASGQNLNTGVATTVTISALATGRFIEEWDLNSPLTGDAIPAGATITSVSWFRRATTAGTGDGGAGTTITHTIQRISRTDWVEGTENNTNDPALDGATWNNFNIALDLTDPATWGGDPDDGEWLAQGGDYTGKTWEYTVETGAGDKTIASTAGLVEMVQAALDDHAGLVSIMHYRGTAGTVQTWATKDNGTAAFRPVMTVEWSVDDAGETGEVGGRVARLGRLARIART